MAKNNKINLLFLCTGNSCRSQMAEAWLRHLKGDKYNAYSAGIEKHGLNPNAVKVMAEHGIDISQQQSQTLDEFTDLDLDIVITVCDHADTTCPTLNTNTKKVHVGFDDPPKLALSAKSEQEALDHYRRVCLEIEKFVETIDDYIL